MIRNLVSCIGKSSYYSTSVFSPGRTSYGFSRGACHLPAPANENGESNAKFYFAFPGGIPRTGRDGIFIQISLDPSSSQEAPRETGAREERGGRRIMRAEVVRPLARSLAHSWLVRPNAVNSICSRPYLTPALGRACKWPGAIDIRLTAAK